MSLIFFLLLSLEASLARTSILVNRRSMLNESAFIVVMRKEWPCPQAFSKMQMHMQCQRWPQTLTLWLRRVILMTEASIIPPVTRMGMLSSHM
ncbi:hypothetical protein GE09DRAFT_726199 [Coniochaeta sp. 2T2.1]|nr:hypothetical protein GE09DRAFT_726199 [Coniochaeta sp. 2T2.1]